MQSSQYTEAVQSGLLFQKTPKVIKSIKERQNVEYFPRGARGGYKQNNIIEVDIKSDMCLDLNTAFLQFTVKVEGTNPENARIATAIDFINEVSAFYNDTELFRTGNNNFWTNHFLLHTANKTFLEGDLSVYAGYGNQFINKFVSPNGKSFAIPLGLLDQFFNQQSFLPAFGNTLRLRFSLAPVVEVLSLVGNANNVYELNDVKVTCDTVVLKSDYAKALMDTMQNGVIRMPYVAIETGRMNLAANTVNNLKYLFNFSNLLSVFLARNQTDVKKVEAGKHVLYCQTADTTRLLKSFKIRTGSNYLVNPNGVNQVEAYLELQKSLGDLGLAAMDGKGLVDRQHYLEAEYKVEADPAGANTDKYPCSILGVNCEKVIQPDDDSSAAINAGLSSVSNGSTNELIITYETTAAPSEKDEMFIALVHRRALVFEKGAYVVEV
jgi:hypothetical protein